MAIDMCNECTLCAARSHVVMGRGPLDAHLAVVGEGPGSDEDASGIPFIGSSGQVLHNILVDAKLSRSFWQHFPYNANMDEWPIPKWTKHGQATLVFKPQVFITNLVRCQPPGNRTPTLTEIKACEQNLLDELSILHNLKVIVPVGETSMNYFTGLKGISKYRGYPFRWQKYLVVPSYHPRFLLSSRKYYPVCVLDIMKADRLARNGWSEPQTDYREASHVPFDTILQEHALGFALDIETTGADEESGLDPRLGSITRLAISSEIGRAVHFDFANLHERSLAKTLAKALPGNITFQNGPFDTAFLTHNGIPCMARFDTRLAQHLLTPHLPKSLEFLNSVNTDYPHYKEMRRDLLQGKLSRSDRIKYCCLDADTTLQNRKVLEAEMHEEGVLPVFQNIVMPLSMIFKDIYLKGIRVDKQALTDTLDPDNPTSIKAKADSIDRMFWKYGVNIRSVPQVKELFFDKLGLPRQKNVQYKTLQKLRNLTRNPVVQAKLDYQDLFTVEKMYKGMLKRTMGTDRVHTKYDVAGTETGRPASTDPNLNNITLDRRHIFLPDEGKVFVQADYSRLELRVAAAYSQDDIMIHDVWERDIHDEVAKSIYKSGYTPAQYLEGKTITFGILYGRTAHSIARAFGITVARAEEYIDTLLRRYAGLQEWRARIRSEAERTDRLCSAFGRIRYFSEGNVASQAYNFPVQSAAADICNSSLIVLATEARLDIMLTVYDSIIVQCLPTETHSVINTLKEVMERPIAELHNMKFPVDIKLGNTWRDMK